MDARTPAVEFRAPAYPGRPRFVRGIVVVPCDMQRTDESGRFYLDPARLPHDIAEGRLVLLEDWSCRVKARIEHDATWGIVAVPDWRTREKLDPGNPPPPPIAGRPVR